MYSHFFEIKFKQINLMAFMECVGEQREKIVIAIAQEKGAEGLD